MTCVYDLRESRMAAAPADIRIVTSPSPRSAPLLTLMVALLVLPASCLGAPARPNLVFILADDLGWADVAYESWLRAIDIDFGKPPRSNDGLHYANVGGMWQQVVFGFGGLASALNEQCLVFKPCLPEQIQSITFPLTWKGQALRVTVSAKNIRVENLSQSTLEFGIGGQKFEVGAGQSTEAGY